MQPIFHWIVLGDGVGGNANFRFGVGGNTNFSVFRYQHVGIPNAILWSQPTRGPNANGFVSQWNIGFRVCVGHGNFMLFIPFSFALVSQHKCGLCWNIGYIVENLPTSSTSTLRQEKPTLYQEIVRCETQGRREQTNSHSCNPCNHDIGCWYLPISAGP